MNYKIGSFNMCRFGRNAKKDLDTIAEIIREESFDVVALQEIFSEAKGLKRLLEECVKYQLYNWDFCWASPKETKDMEKEQDMIEHETRGECYAYLWNKKRFKLVEYTKLGQTRVFEPRIVNSLDGSDARGTDCTIFARTPYYIRLQPLYGGFFELRLIDIHIYFGDKKSSSIQKRQKEFDVLTKEIYPKISTKRYGQNRTPYTIAMGDYNLNLFSPLVRTLDGNCYVSRVYSYQDGIKTVNVLTVQDNLTTLRRIDPSKPENPFQSPYANNFDHFTYSPELSEFVNVSYEVIDVVNKYCNGDSIYYFENISDHLPIAMNIEI